MPFASYLPDTGESYSAGRLYDKIQGDVAYGRVLYVLPKGVLCTFFTEVCKNVVVE